MKVSTLQLFFIILVASYANAGRTHAQELLMKKVSVEAQQQQILVILTELEQAANVKFVYSKQLLPVSRKVTLTAINKPLSEILDMMFSPDNITYRIVKNRIILKLAKPTAALEDVMQQIVAMDDAKVVEKNGDRDGHVGR